MDSRGNQVKARNGAINFANSIVEDLNRSYVYWEIPANYNQDIEKPVFDRNTTLNLLERYQDMVGKYLQKNTRGQPYKGDKK